MHAHVLVDQQNVRVLARFQRALARLHADAARGGQRRAVHGLIQRRATVNAVVAHRVVHAQHAACEEAEPDPAYSYLDWQDVSVLRDSGHVEICNHSYDMHNLEGRRGVGQLEGESYEDYRKVFLNDTTKLQTLCDEHCGFQPNVYTYPFGITCESASRLVKNMGFEASLGVEEKINIIKKEDERCLFGLYRYNRSGIISTEEFMKKVFGA